MIGPMIIQLYWSFTNGNSGSKYSFFLTTIVIHSTLSTLSTPLHYTIQLSSTTEKPEPHFFGINPVPKPRSHSSLSFPFPSFGFGSKSSYTYNPTHQHSLPRRGLGVTNLVSVIVLSSAVGFSAAFVIALIIQCSDPAVARVRTTHWEAAGRAWSAGRGCNA